MLPDLQREFPVAQWTGISHSIGAMLLTTAPGCEHLTKMGFIVPHTGFYGDYRHPDRALMAVFWHGIMPLLTRLHGFFAARRRGSGDDIPAAVALQWATRRTPDLRGYRGPAQTARLRACLKRGSELPGPALVVKVSDDPFATPDGTRRMLATAPRVRAQIWRVTPADVGLMRIGHFGCFSRRMQPTLWPQFLAHFLQLAPSRIADTACGAALRDQGERRDR